MFSFFGCISANQNKNVNFYAGQSENHRHCFYSEGKNRYCGYCQTKNIFSFLHRKKINRCCYN